MTYRSAAPQVLVSAGSGIVMGRELRSGRVLWRVAVPPTAPTRLDLLQSPTRIAAAGDFAIVLGVEEKDGGMLSTATAVHVVLGLDLQTGALRWRTVLYETEVQSGTATLLVTDDVIVVSDAVATVALALATGASLWSTLNDPSPAVSGFALSARGVALAVPGQAVQSDGVGWK